MDRALGNSSPSTRGGFSLVEILLAAGTLAIAALGFAASVPSSHRLSQSSRSESAVNRAMSAISAAMDAAPFSEVAVQFHARGFEIPGVTPLRDDYDGLPGELIFEAAPGGVPDCYRVRIRVRWRDAAGEHTVENVRFLANVRDDPGDPVPLGELDYFYGASNGYFPDRHYFYR